jgi:hypothetical protein
MGGRSARTKGSAAEREVINILKEAGYTKVSRSPNSGGWILKGDVLWWEDFFVEVKRQEKLSIPAWWQKCVEQAGSTKIPLLIFRRSREEWKVTMRLDDFLGLLEKSKK